MRRVLSPAWHEWLSWKWKIYCCLTDDVVRTSKFWNFYFVVWQTTSENCTKKCAARAARLFFLIQRIKLLIGGVTRCSCSRRFLNSSLTHFLLRVSNGFLKLHLSFLEKIEENSKFQKNVPLKVILLSSSGTMTIGKLKGLLYRLFKVDITDQQLYCVDSKVITANFIPFF